MQVRLPLLALLLVLAACGGGAKEPKDPSDAQSSSEASAAEPPMREPTEGICTAASGPTPLQAADDALTRGCPRLAAQQLGRFAPKTPADKFNVALMALEAKEDARTEGYDRWAPAVAIPNETELAPEPWMLSADDNVGLFGDVNAIWKGLGDGSVTEAQLKTTRYARAFIRGTFANSCLFTQNKEFVAPLAERSAASRLDYFKLTRFTAQSSPEMHREFARAWMWTCDLPKARAFIARATEMTGARGQGTEALDPEIYLDTVDRLFPGGRAGDMNLGLF